MEAEKKEGEMSEQKPRVYKFCENDVIGVDMEVVEKSDYDALASQLDAVTMQLNSQIIVTGELVKKLAALEARMKDI